MTEQIIYLVVFLVTVIAFIVRMIWLEDKVKIMDARLDTYRDALQNVRGFQVSIEGRTAFYVPKSLAGMQGTSGGGITQNGYSFNDDYIGVDRVVQMILRHLNLGIRRPANDVCLIDVSANGVTGRDGKS